MILTEITTADIKIPHNKEHVQINNEKHMAGIKR